MTPVNRNKVPGTSRLVLGFIDDIFYLAQTSAVAYAPADIRHDLMDSIAIAVQVGNALAIRRSREMSLLDRRRRYQMSVAQALINRDHQPIPPWSSLDNATSDSQPSQAMISPQRVIEVDVISSPQPDHSTFALPEDDEMIVDYVDIDGGAIIDLSAPEGAHHRYHLLRRRWFDAVLRLSRVLIDEFTLMLYE